MAAEKKAARIAAKEEAARMAAEKTAARVAAKEEAARVAAEKKAARIKEAARVLESERARIAAEEAVAARVAAETAGAEAARLAAEQAERERIAAAEEAEATRVAAEKAEAERIDANRSSGVVDDSESMEEPEPRDVAAAREVEEQRKLMAKAPKTAEIPTPLTALGTARLTRPKRKPAVPAWTWRVAAMWIAIVAVSLGYMMVDYQLMVDWERWWQQQEQQEEKQEEVSQTMPVVKIPSFHVDAPVQTTHSGCACLTVTRHHTVDGLMHSWVGCGEMGWWCVASLLHSSRSSQVIC